MYIIFQRSYFLKVKIVLESKYRRCIAIDKTELKVKGSIVYVWSAVDVDSRELLALEASYCRSCLNTIKFIKKVLKLCLNKPKIKLIEVHGIYWL
ncbi:MAG: DDE-type integrase/transposase/recombinase [Nitrososphaerota archaeon]